VSRQAMRFLARPSPSPSPSLTEPVPYLTPYLTSPHLTSPHLTLPYLRTTSSHLTLPQDESDREDGGGGDGPASGGTSMTAALSTEGLDALLRVLSRKNEV